MSCSQFEKQIALYVEGDLGGRKARQVEEHLHDCPACRELAEEIADSQAALKGLRAEAVDGVVLERIRRRVLDEVGGQRPSLRYAWRWKHALAAGLVVVAVAMSVLLRQQSSEAPVALAPELPKREVVPPAPPPPAPPVQAARKTPRRRVDVPARPSQGRTPVPQELVSPDFEIPRIEPPRIEPARIDPPASSNQLVVKLLTDDPEVVIYWLIDTNGD
jgi:anti-sigma factor RsiW